MPGRGYRRHDRFRYRLLRLTITYIVIAAAASFAVLFMLNGNVSAQPAPAPTLSQTATPAPTPTPTATSPYALKITGVPTDTKEIYFSYDGKYCAYQNGTGVVVLDTAADKTLKTIDDPNIAWMQFVDSRDIVLYLTLQGNSVAVNTYDIGSGVQAKQTSFTVPANSKVKAAAFSSAKNYLCVNIETDSDEVYTVDIMKNTARLTLQDIINNMVLPHRTEQVYYTNSKGMLYYGNKAVSDVEAGTLLGCDAKDKVYFQTSADRSVVYAVADGKKEKSIQMPDVTNLVRFCNTYSGDMYAVYDGFLVDLSGDATAQIPFDKGLDFVGIGGKNVFFRNASGEILGITLLG